MKKGTVSRVFSLCLYTSKHNFQINLVPLSGIRSQCPISVTPVKSYDIKSLSINTAVTRSGGLVLVTLAWKKPTFVWLLKTLKGKPPSCATKHFFSASKLSGCYKKQFESVPTLNFFSPIVNYSSEFHEISFYVEWHVNVLVFYQLEMMKRMDAAVKEQL